jgi:uncharacterized protein YbjT (DUF2867 family)
LRVFVAGAYGFIGRHVVDALLRGGHDVIAGGRDVVRGRKLFRDIEWVRVDFGADHDPDLWRDRFAGCDGVVNCVGVLQSGPRGSSRVVHVTATVALFRGAAAASVKRLVHISVPGADPGGATDFARDKAAADDALAAIDIDWIILRPSLVYADRNSGGTALIERLAMLPVVALPAGDISFEPIHADDLAAIVVRCLDPEVPGKRVYEVGGPETMTLREIVTAMRAAGGLGPTAVFAIPDFALRPMLWVGDFAGWLGMPGPMRSTTLDQARRTPAVNSDAIRAVTGIVPRRMRVALAGAPT